ncbi:uncharacterized protein METZ01_LOCUS229807, partial [marine metagenome]
PDCYEGHKSLSTEFRRTCRCKSGRIRATSSFRTEIQKIYRSSNQL